MRAARVRAAARPRRLEVGAQLRERHEVRVERAELSDHLPPLLVVKDRDHLLRDQLERRHVQRLVHDGRRAVAERAEAHEARLPAARAARRDRPHDRRDAQPLGRAEFGKVRGRVAVVARRRRLDRREPSGRPARALALVVAHQARPPDLELVDRDRARLGEPVRVAAALVDALRLGLDRSNVERLERLRARARDGHVERRPVPPPAAADRRRVVVAAGAGLARAVVRRDVVVRHARRVQGGARDRAAAALALGAGRATRRRAAASRRADRSGRRRCAPGRAPAPCGGRARPAPRRARRRRRAAR